MGAVYVSLRLWVWGVCGYERWVSGWLSMDTLRSSCDCICMSQCLRHIGIAHDLKWGERCRNCNCLHLHQRRHHNSDPHPSPPPTETVWNVHAGDFIPFIYFFLLLDFFVLFTLFFFCACSMLCFSWRIYAVVTSVLKPKVGVELDSATRKDEEEEKSKTQKNRFVLKDTQTHTLQV